jgi:hypothetical protein
MPQFIVVVVATSNDSYKKIYLKHFEVIYTTNIISVAIVSVRRKTFSACVIDFRGSFMSRSSKASDHGPTTTTNGKTTYAPIAPAPFLDSTSTTDTRPPTNLKPAPIAPSSTSQTTSACAATVQGSSTISSGQKRSPSSRPPNSPSKNNNNNKKRPYRRTKRPAGYNDRSTITTVTKKDPKSAVSIDAYDAVVAECEDLLNASLEAQQLGRLKMASAYQLLLHTRLVGLGKQFDRNAMKHVVVNHNIMSSGAAASTTTPWASQQQQQQPTVSERKPSATTSSVGARFAAEGGNDQQKETTPLSTETAASLPKDHNANGTTPEQQAEHNLLKQLSSILPQDAIMDATMMEHLACAAAELHHQRTGRKRSSEGLLASPMNSLEIMTKQKATVSDPSKVAPIKSPSQISRPTPVESSRWTNAEMDIVEKGIQKKWQPETIAKILSNKNEQQIREYLKQRAEGKAGLRQQYLFQKEQQNQGRALSAARNTTVPTRSVPNAAGGGAAASSSTKAAAAKITSGSSNHDAPHTYFDSAGSAERFNHSIDGSPNSKQRRGGRGRKPPTTAMNTVPTISLDVRTLLKGKIGLQTEQEK